MSDEKSKNPYLAFIEADEAPRAQPAESVEPATSTQAMPQEPMVTEPPTSSNPYINIMNAEEEKKSILDEQVAKEALAGAGAGAAYKVHQMRVDARGGPKTFIDPNAPMTSKGLQAYLNSQISPKYNLPLKQLERVVGTELRTMSEVQQALKFIQGEEAQRVAKTITDPTGMKRNIYRTIPGREPVDLSAYERSIANKAMAAAKATPPVVGKIARGAVAGAAGVPMAIQMYKQEEPTDWTQWSSLVGSGLGMTRSGPLGAAGLAMQAPYIVKHAPEISAGLGLGEINPTAFGGAPEALSLQEETIPEHESMRRMREASKAGAGRGFVNPPLALP